MKLSDLPMLLKCSKENHDLCRKIRETWKANSRKRSESECQTGKRHHFAEAAQIFKNQSAGSLAQFSGDSKQKSDGQSMGKHQNSSPGGTKDAGRGDTEKDITHVHHA